MSILVKASRLVLWVGWVSPPILLMRTVYHLLFKDFDRNKAIAANQVTIDNQFYDNEESQWWHPSSQLIGLLAMTPVRAGFFDKVLQEQFPDKKNVRVADVGCGGGFLSENMAKRGYSMIGIDMSPNTIEQAKQHAASSELQITYEVGNAYELSNLPDASVDAVLMADVLEHFHDLPRAAKTVARVLKPGGIFIFDTINRTAKSFAVMIALFQECPVQFLPNHLHDWSLFITPRELTQVFAKEGIEIRQFKGLAPKFSLTTFKAAFLGTFNDLAFQIVDDVSLSYIGYGRKADN